MHCTKCKTYRTSRHDASCHSYCGSGDCKIICSYCGERSLIDSSVIAVGRHLGLTENNPILVEFQQRMARVNAGGWRDEFTMKINSSTVEGYQGPTRFVTYNKNQKFQITGVTFYDDY